MPNPPTTCMYERTLNTIHAADKPQKALHARHNSKSASSQHGNNVLGKMHRAYALWTAETATWQEIANQTHRHNNQADRPRYYDRSNPSQHQDRAQATCYHPVLKLSSREPWPTKIPETPKLTASRSMVIKQSNSCQPILLTGINRRTSPQKPWPLLPKQPEPNIRAGRMA